MAAVTKRVRGEREFWEARVTIKGHGPYRVEDTSTLCKFAPGNPCQQVRWDWHVEPRLIRVWVSLALKGKQQ